MDGRKLLVAIAGVAGLALLVASSQARRVGHHPKSKPRVAVATAASTPRTVVQAMAKADAYWLAHGVKLTGATWQNAAFQVGNLAYLATSGANPNTATQTWAKNNHDTVDSSTGPARPDDLAAGEVYLGLRQPTSIRARVASEVAAGNYTLWSYVDAVNMAMPSYARLGVLDSSASDLNATRAQFNYTEKTLGLFDDTPGLWWRDANYKGTSTFWSRGNGWAMMALAKVLQILPSTAPGYAEYLRVFDKMAAALAPLQLSDGFWGADLRNPSAYGYEESGTAFLTYAMAWGINAGILDPRVYKPVVTKAWTALMTIALQPSGEVGYVQGATTGASKPSDGQPVKVIDTSAYGVGGFLLAGSQMVHVLPPTVALSPVISHARLTHRRFRVATHHTVVTARTVRANRAPRGTSFLLTLSETARLRIVIASTLPGLHRGRSCVEPSTKLRRTHARRCARTHTVGALTRANELRGDDGIRFSGQIGHRRLLPGNYKATLTASNALGTSRPITVPFTIVR